MALNFLTPEQIADDYLLYLKATRPTVDTSQTDSDWWVKSRPIGGVGAGLYSDQRLVNQDTFAQSARHDALGQFLALYLDDNFKSETAASGLVAVPGASGTVVPAGLEFVYEPNGNTYISTAEVDYGSATAALFPVTSVDTGASQNLLSGAPLTVSSPPAGVGSTASASGNIADGRDLETDDEARARILARIQNPPAGGNQADYAAWALAADPSVTSAAVLRFPFGFGSVGVVITAGTTDIDTAIDNGIPIVRTPSDSLVSAVKAYVSALCPTTDCVTVFGAQEIQQNVTVAVRYVQGDGSTVLAGQTLTQDQLVQREVSRALYKIPPGGRKLGAPASGFVLASEIEEVIDVGLSASPYIPGTLPILSDRQVQALSATGTNALVGSNQIVAPGVITIVAMT